MENWEQKLDKVLVNRQKKDHSVDDLKKAQKEIIVPVFEKIKKHLYEYSIKVNINKDEPSLSVVHTGGFDILKLYFEEVQEGNAVMKIDITIEFDTVILDSGTFSQTISINSISEEIIGEFFVNNFNKISGKFDGFNKK